MKVAFHCAERHAQWMREGSSTISQLRSVTANRWGWCFRSHIEADALHVNNPNYLGRSRINLRSHSAVMGSFTRAGSCQISVLVKLAHIDLEKEWE